MPQLAALPPRANSLGTWPRFAHGTSSRAGSRCGREVAVRPKSPTIPAVSRTSHTPVPVPNRLKQEKEDLARQVEFEEEMITNKLSKKLEQVKQEKVNLENLLEQEQVPRTPLTPPSPPPLPPVSFSVAPAQPPVI